ncbi:MAG: isoleucine--tRNA ligase [Candidatus Pacearchaeota archaeon]
MNIEELKKIQFEHEEWLREREIYKRLFAREGKKFYFLDGPPYANDVPHIGHIKNFIIKDLVLRQKAMQGYKIFFKPGFDTHGLPIENAVEKKLGLKSKKDIENLGVDRFLKICRENATLNKDLWLIVYKLYGFVFHNIEPYLTYNNSYIESAWWTFKRLWEKGLVYKGTRPVHFCSHCGTSLAGYEVTDSYITLKDPSIYVLFKLKEKVRGKEAYMLVWTTTPWTLAANVALAIREDADYALVQLSDGRHIILAESRLELLSELGYAFTLIEKLKGKELVGLSYEPILDLPIQAELEEMKAKNPAIHTIIASIKMLKERIASKTAAKKGIATSELYEDFVNLNEGTGIVHTAGGHGKTDYEISCHYNLPSVSPLDDECKFDERAGKLRGSYVKDADKIIIAELEKEGKLLFATEISHTYPICWRCKTPLIVKLSEQYFISIGPIKQKMLDEIERVRWLPEFAKERMFNWVINASDWNISRQRYWGIPMPIWQCSNPACKATKVIASFKELDEEMRKINKSLSESFDLHNAIKIKLSCDECGSEMEKVPYIFDVWFDSSIAAWASLGYPYYDDDLFDTLWPADRINEGQDQIRGWFYALLFSGVACFGRAPYKEVSMVGWIVDEKGEKMSKSLGNVVYAKSAVEQFGADLLRFYLLYDAPPSGIQAINLENVTKEPLKFFNTLHNIWNFYAQIGPAERASEEIEDRLFLSKLNSLIKNYTEAIDNFELNTALKLLYDFVLNDFSRTYIKLVREKAARKKLLIKKALKEICKLLCIVSPFYADWLWQKLREESDEESVVLEKWPKYNEKLIDSALEENFKLIEKIIEAGLAIRASSKLNLRWPLNAAFIFTDDEKAINAVKQFEELLKAQLNVKRLVLARTKDLRSKDESVQVLVGLFIALSKEISKELLAEGFAREIARHVQDARKRLNLKKENEIELELVMDNELLALLREYKGDSWIKQKVNARSFSIALEKSPKKFDFEEDIGVREKVIGIRINKI